MNQNDEQLLLNQIINAIENAGYEPKVQIQGYLSEHNSLYITRNNNARELIGKISEETLKRYLQTE